MTPPILSGSEAEPCISEKEMSLKGGAAEILPLSVMPRRKISQIGLLTASLRRPEN